ncbi:MAG: choice-of-anchor J domain-containing protein [Bacteroidales bacterium]|nr:choice-of-anchor J domain-containing protein [Bacteroidales bacterium]
MKKLLLFITLLLGSQVLLLSQNAWFNEIHYDNASTDFNEFIEVIIQDAGSYSLSDFSVTLYNGNNGESYDTKSLDQFTEGITVDGFTFFYYIYPSNGIQNGENDGMALSLEGTVIAGQFLSWEGTLTAIDGPAAGMTSTDIGVSESSSTEIGQSLQLAGEGTQYSEFTWQDPAAETPGAINNNQSIGTFVPDPEPTNYPTNFAALAEGFSITVTWTDAIGDQLPAGYLIQANEDGNFTFPEDFTTYPNDPDLSDGTATVNIPFGTETLAFSGLATATTYYFIIFPYTNANEFIDYKTDEDPPQDDATTSNLIIINSEDFNDETLGSWTQFNVTGEQLWEATFYGSDYYAKISGYAGGSFENEDWLISPAMNFNNYINESIQFETAMNYDGPMLEVKISTDFDGVSDPNTATWELITATLSGGGWEWVASGNVDVSGFDGENVYIAFMYTSTSQEASTWELDNILVTGEENVGIAPTLLESDVSIYPNPASDYLIMEQLNGSSTVKIFTLDGRLVYNNQQENSYLKIDINEWSKGMYLIEISDQSTGSSVTKKVSIR